MGGTHPAGGGLHARPGRRSTGSSTSSTSTRSRRACGSPRRTAARSPSCRWARRRPASRSARRCPWARTRPCTSSTTRWHGSDALATSAGAGRGARPDRVRPGHPRLGVDRRADGRAAGDAGRAARRPAAVAAPARSRSTAPRSRSTGRPTTATTRSRRPCPRVVSVVEKINEPRYPSFKGIMAAKKKPVRDAEPGRRGHRRRARSGWRAAATEVVELRQAAAAAGGHGRHRRGRRRRQGGRVPRRPEVHLSRRAKGYGRSWLRSWSSSSTPAGRSRRSPSSC